MGLLSVVIINYNTYELTCNCIASIYQCTRKIDFEIVLVDNGSIECDPQLFLTKFPDIKLVCSPINTGFAAGNNLGIRQSNGDAILLLNSDTELIEDSLSYCYEYLTSVPDQVVVTCKLVYPNGVVQHQCSRFPSVYLNLLELSRVHKLLSDEKRSKLLLSSYFDNEISIEPDWIWGTFFMFKKDILVKLNNGKLDETFFMYCEDVKWCYDFKKLGVGISYLAGTKIIHHVGSSSSSELRINNITKNELLFIQLTKGRIYKWFYAIIRAANLLSTFSKANKQVAISLIKNI